MTLRDEAIKLARARQLNGYILTSNGSRADLERLRQLGGGDVLVAKISQAEACARVAVLVGGSRLAACELGIKKRWFGRYQKTAGDIEVEV